MYALDSANSLSFVPDSPPSKPDPREKLEHVYQSIKLLHQTNPAFGALLPLRTIRMISSGCLPEFIQLVLDTLFKGDFEDFENRTLVTSCVNTFYSMSSLCLGLQKTGKMKWVIDVEPQFKVSFLLPSKNLFPVEIYHLFAGNVTQTLHEDPLYSALKTEEKRQRIYNLALPYLKAFSDFVLQEKKSCESDSDLEVAHTILKIIKSSKFAFNRTTLSLLRGEFKKRAPLVSEVQSFLYCISTKKPHFERDESLPPDEREVYVGSTIEHAFLLEQFQCPKDKTMRVRLYQSWIDQATLLDEMQKYYLDDFINSWDEQGLENFLDRLESYYCSETGYLESERALACFGYNQSEIKRDIPIKYPLVISHGNKVTGISLRYIVEPFNPNESHKNLRSLAREEAFL